MLVSAQIESAFHEMLLQSPHRTLDPEAADFFYVPVYTSCFIHLVYGWADTPWFHNPGGRSGAYGNLLTLGVKHKMPDCYGCTQQHPLTFTGTNFPHRSFTCTCIFLQKAAQFGLPMILIVFGFIGDALMKYSVQGLG